jgi:hypothetical protein
MTLPPGLRGSRLGRVLAERQMGAARVGPLSELTSLEVLALEDTAVDCVGQAAAIRALGSKIREFVVNCPSDVAAE